MSGLERKEKEIGLVDLNKQEADKEKEKKAGTVPKRTVERQKNTIRTTVTAVAVCSLLLILLGTRLCGLSLPMVCIVMVIEAVLAAALNDSKLWIHIGIMLIEIIMGIVFGHALFLVLAAAYYFVVLVAMKLFGLES